jgi:hypothetical protein
MSFLTILSHLLGGAASMSPPQRQTETPSESKLKHLEFVQSAIARMSTASFVFKGWAVTVATGLAAFAAIESKRSLLVIALVPTVLFWAMDAYYLWLERGFVKLHQVIVKQRNDEINFDMRIDKARAFRGWLRTCVRWHLLLFYLAIILVNVAGIIFLKEGK